jgi:hypothetical protein
MTKSSALKKAVDNYKTNKTYVKQYQSLINTAKQNSLKALQEDLEAQGMFADNPNIIGDLLQSASRGDWDKVVKDLQFERNEYIRLRNEANMNYEKWAGTPYEALRGGITPDDFDYDDEEDTEIQSPEDVKKQLKDVWGQDVPPITKTEQDKKNQEFEDRKKVETYQDKHIDTSDATYDGIEYQEFSRPKDNKEAKEIATALGEESYSDVRKKYLSSNKDAGFPPRLDRAGWRPSTVKREEAEKYLDSLLESNNMSPSDVANYIANNNSRSFEKEFQKFLENKKVSKYNARDILSSFALSTYKLQEGTITDFMSNFSPRAVGGAHSWEVYTGKKKKGRGKGWKNTKGYKKGNKVEIENLLKNYESVGEYEILSLLYEFMGTKKDEDWPETASPNELKRWEQK